MFDRVLNATLGNCKYLAKILAKIERSQLAEYGVVLSKSNPVYFQHKKRFQDNCTIFEESNYSIGC